MSIYWIASDTRFIECLSSSFVFENIQPPPLSSQCYHNHFYITNNLLTETFVFCYFFSIDAILNGLEFAQNSL